ncbi:MAG TPA: hypothetical protein VF037_07980, partial [Gemmatimonadales bacterium]
MPVAVFTDPSALLHDAGPGHPERPARLEAILAALRTDPLVELREPPPADRALLEAVHAPGYLARLEALAAAGGGRLDEDTVMNASSWKAALHAAGGATAAIRHA